jgi:hypothetical protein
MKSYHVRVARTGDLAGRINTAVARLTKSGVDRGTNLLLRDYHQGDRYHHITYAEIDINRKTLTRGRKSNGKDTLTMVNRERHVLAAQDIC